MTITVSEDQKAIIIEALRIAEWQWRKDADTNEGSGQTRIAEAFIRQADNAEDLAEDLE